MQSRSYEKDYHTQMDLNIERDLDQFTVERHGYHLFDFMSDIGGMQGLLYSGFAFFISIWNYMMFDNYMVSRLYKREQSEQDTSQIRDKLKQSNFMKPNSCFNPKEYFKDLCPSWLCFCRRCKPDRLERGFFAARELLKQETNIIDIIKSRRYFNAALHFLLTKSQRIRIKEKSRYTHVNPDFKKNAKKEDDSNEYTDDFYTSESDVIVPNDAHVS